MVDPAFITPFGEKPDYVTNTRVWKVERETTQASSAIPLAPPRGPPKWPFARKACAPTMHPSNPKIRAKGASRTLTTRAMAAAPGALTPFNGAHRHRSWLGARTSRFIGRGLVRRLHFGYILDASIRLHCFLMPRRVVLRIHAYGPF